jgi:hypothetical protein
MPNARSTMRATLSVSQEVKQPVQLLTSNASWRLLLVSAMTALVLLSNTQRAAALIVENMAGTTSPPADDPGWNFVSDGGSRAFTYLGNGWALSAFHVGAPITNEAVVFNGSSFNIIPGQDYAVPNPSGQGLTALTDLRLIRLNGDVGTPTFSIASSELTETTPIAQRQVTIVGAGPTREANRSYWNVTHVNPGADTWVDATSSSFTHSGYRAIPVETQPEIKRWGTNQIADEDSLLGNNDNDLRGKLTITLGGGQGNRDIMSMFTQFDQNGLPNEAQVVSGDSGSAVFHKRNGQWELIGVVNAQHYGMVNSSQALDGQKSNHAVYGNYTTFADLSFYRNEIMNIMNSNQNYSIMGDVNLDGIANGGTSGGSPTGDIAAFVAGWGYNNGTGIGTIDSWKKGDLNRDGKVDAADFVLLRAAVNPTGSGNLSLGSLFGGGVVPEPSSLLLALATMSLLANYRRRR